MPDYDEIADRVFGKTPTPHRYARERLTEPVVAGHDLASMSDEELLGLLHGLQMEREQTEEAYRRAKRARDLVTYYIWANRGEVRREDMLGVLGISSSMLSTVISHTKRHLRQSMEKGVMLPEGTDDSNLSAVRKPPQWAVDSPLDNIIIDLHLFGGYA